MNRTRATATSALVVAGVFAASWLTGAPQEEVIVGTDTAVGDQFSFDMELDGNTLVATAISNDTDGMDRGAAYVFERDGGGWVQQDRLGPEAAGMDSLGTRIDIRGDTLVVSGSTAGIGRVAVYERQNGAWGAPQLLDPTGTVSNTLDVATDGDWIIVGAFNDMGDRAGAAFVYKRNANTGTWEEHQKLLPPGVVAGAFFGFAVDIDGERLVVGALRFPTNGLDQAGAVYVFELDDGTGMWEQSRMLIASDPGAGDRFGSVVAIDDDTILVDARGDDDAGDDAGAVYAFERGVLTPSGEPWGEVQKFVLPDAQAGDLLAVPEIEGDLAVVGARSRDNSTGVAYLLERTGGLWSVVGTLAASDGAQGDFYGYAKISGTTVVVSSPNHDAGSGAVYSYEVNTRIGTGFEVRPIDTTTQTTPVSVLFQMVTEAGTTTLTTSDVGPPPPVGFEQLTPPVYYDVGTTAAFSGPAIVCVDYSGSGFEANEASLQLHHFEGGAWENRTISRDPENDQICASVDSLSPFAVFQPEFGTEIDLLMERIAALGGEGAIPPSVERFLTRRLDRARRLLESFGNKTAAVAQVNLFLFRVWLLRVTNTIPPDVGRELIDAGRSIRRRIVAA